MKYKFSTSSSSLKSHLRKEDSLDSINNLILFINLIKRTFMHGRTPASPQNLGRELSLILLNEVKRLVIVQWFPTFLDSRNTVG